VDGVECHQLRNRRYRFALACQWHQTGYYSLYAHHPVLCDRLYGGRVQITRGEIEHRREDEEIVLNRQALHARRLKVRHPITQLPIEFVAPLPPEFEAVLELLRKFRRRS